MNFYDLSVFFLFKILREHGLIVENVLILLDRDQGAEQKLSKNGLKMHR